MMTKGRIGVLLPVFMTAAIGLPIGCAGTSGNAPTDESQATESRRAATNDIPAVPASPEVNHDSGAYSRVAAALEAHKSIMPIDEFLAKTGLAGIEFSVRGVTNMADVDRIYHCGGFYVTLRLYTVGPGDADSDVLRKYEPDEVVVVSSRAQIDGLTDPEERMKQIEDRYRNPYLKPDSSPVLRIEAVVTPAQKSDPLKLSVQLETNGTTPIAFSQDQLTVRISTTRKPYLFACDAVFAANEQQVFTIEPEQPLVVSFFTSANRFGNHERWSELPRGQYQLRVDLGGPKDRKFDYQWSGRTYSGDFLLTIQ